MHVFVEITLKVLFKRNVNFLQHTLIRYEFFQPTHAPDSDLVRIQRRPTDDRVVRTTGAAQLDSEGVPPPPRRTRVAKDIRVGGWQVPARPEMRQVPQPRGGEPVEGAQEVLQVEGLHVRQVHPHRGTTEGHGRPGWGILFF